MHPSRSLTSAACMLNLIPAGRGAFIDFVNSDVRLEEILPRGMTAAGSREQGHGTPLPLAVGMFRPTDLSKFLPEGPRTILGYINRDTPVFRGALLSVQHYNEGNLIRKEVTKLSNLLCEGLVSNFYAHPLTHSSVPIPHCSVAKERVQEKNIYVISSSVCMCVLLCFPFAVVIYFELESL